MEDELGREIPKFRWNMLEQGVQLTMDDLISMAKMDGPIITPCRGCSDYDGYGGCKSKGGCARAKMEAQE